jgi:hypothetical protein
MESFISYGNEVASLGVYCNNTWFIKGNLALVEYHCVRRTQVDGEFMAEKFHIAFSIKKVNPLLL